MGTFITIILVAGVIGGVAVVVMKSKAKKAMEDYLVTKGFNATKKIISEDANTGIALDSSSKTICLLKRDPGGITAQVIPYSDVLSSEILEDGNTIMKTKTGSQVGRAVAGGVLLGPLGAVVGGVTGKKEALDKAKSVDLKITINSTVNPIHMVRFLNIETKKDSSIYKSAIGNARQWQALMDVVINQANKS